MGIYQKVWGRIPFFTSLLLLIIPIFYVVCIQIDGFFLSICNDDSTILKGQIYRLFTSGFAYPHLYSLILTMVLLYCESSELERVIGSATYFIHLSLKTIILNTFTWIFVLPIFFAIDNLHGTHRDFGFFPSILSDIIVRTYYRPNELRFKILNKVYALVIMLALLITNLEYIPFNFISISLYTFIEIKYANGMLLRLYKRHVQFIESCVFFCCKNRRDFVRVADCSDFLFKRTLEEENQNTEHLQEMCENNGEEDEEDGDDEEDEQQQQNKEENQIQQEDLEINQKIDKNEQKSEAISEVTTQA